MDFIWSVNSRTTLQRITVVLKQHSKIVTGLVFSTLGNLKVLKWGFDKIKPFTKLWTVYSMKSHVFSVTSTWFMSKRLIPCFPLSLITVLRQFCFVVSWFRQTYDLGSQTRLSNFTFTFHFHALEKEMATHSSSCLENPRDGEAWWAAVSGVAQSWTWLTWLSSSSSSSMTWASLELTQGLLNQSGPPVYQKESTDPWENLYTLF